MNFDPIMNGCAGVTVKRIDYSESAYVLTVRTIISNDVINIRAGDGAIYASILSPIVGTKSQSASGDLSCQRDDPDRSTIFAYVKVDMSRGLVDHLCVKRKNFDESFMEVRYICGRGWSTENLPVTPV
ncbi:MAG: hypothetical protein WAZ19_16390 [Anaerolineae bacterium]